MKPDAQIQREVLDELAWDTHVEPNDVGVTVHAGVVTLTGTVSSFAKKLAAESAAHHVTGVLDVANDVVVKMTDGVERSDSEIAAAARRALQWDVFVPDAQIQTTVTDGLVRLTGHVAYASQREDAARAVGNLAGVRAVDNLITVDQPKASPQAIRDAIHDALERRADRDSDKIEVEVDGGRVTLHGTVQSWREREAIVGAARGTRGVQAVIDRMRIG